MPNTLCHVTLAGTDVYIQTYELYYVSLKGPSYQIGHEGECATFGLAFL